MIEIMKELTIVKKTVEITSKQVLAWASRVKAQEAQKALTEATKDNKEFDTMINHAQKNNTADRPS